MEHRYYDDIFQKMLSGSLFTFTCEGHTAISTRYEKEITYKVYGVDNTTPAIIYAVLYDNLVLGVKVECEDNHREYWFNYLPDKYDSVLEHDLVDALKDISGIKPARQIWEFYDNYEDFVNAINEYYVQK